MIDGRRIILLVLLFRAILLNGQSPQLIIWSNDSCLKWSDYIATPDQKSPHGAISAVAIQVSRFRWSDNSMKGQVGAYFLRDSSWAKVKNAEILTHEQGHFNISELYARKIRQALTTKKIRTEGFSNRFDEIVEKYRRESNVCQDAYDAETEHHLNEVIQVQWDDKIRRQLLQLAKYSNPDIVIRLK